MTPSEIETMARQQYNAVSDDFFSQAEIMNYIYKAQMSFCKYTNMLRTLSTDSTVIDQEAYDFPTGTMSIKRMEIDDIKVHPIDFMERDRITVRSSVNQITSDQPNYYSTWDRKYYLTPIPSEVKTITLYTYDYPAAVTISSTIEIPEEYHLDIVDFCVWQMATKDENPNAAKIAQNSWVEAMREARKLERRKLRGDSFLSVTDVDLGLYNGKRRF